MTNTKSLAIFVFEADGDDWYFVIGIVVGYVKLEPFYLGLLNFGFFNCLAETEYQDSRYCCLPPSASRRSL
jgi:hypothetical protein